MAAAIIIATGASTSRSAAGAQAPQRDASFSTGLFVWVYNYAGAPHDVLRNAERQAGQIFAISGILTTWHECTVAHQRQMRLAGNIAVADPDCAAPLAGTDVRLRVLKFPPTGGLNGSAGDLVFGSAVNPVFATVYYQSVANLTGDDFAIPVFLGDVMAHEIGHLLLGPDSHSPTGIMCAVWDRRYMQRALWSGHFFTAAQSERLQAAVHARIMSSRAARSISLPTPDK